ncbi:fungal-specific transcription factor domain-containing protein [Massariosphaeria phaeospora]|uniref:Fungal-specific transcription factor domain-containing protein n=1 Tax=Massariosphaeria phaeospora TaxID=100035 RepID=A0A7C8I1M0_9PLEO|nr:fungal-specific transcription factor domain-containing protein [Massariosphaeria phaeospora]
MDADRRLTKALEAANDALQHLSMSSDFATLDCTHIDRLLARVVDLPTEGVHRNSRRNLLVIRQWMLTEGPGVVLLEVLGQLYWRLGELNGKQFERFKASLQEQKPYLSLIQDTSAVTLVIQRIRHIQRSKSDACQDFLCDLSDVTGIKVEPSSTEMEALRATSTSPLTPPGPFTPPASIHSLDSSASQETGFGSLIKHAPRSSMWGGDMEKLLIDFYVNGFCPGRTPSTGSNTYLSLLRIAENSESTRYALLSLSASYICDYLHSEKERFHQAELFYSTQALQALARQITNGQSYDAALATSMLLMHHDAVSNSDELSLCWSCHANIFDTIPAEYFNHRSDPALFIRTQLVLARTSQTSYTLKHTRLHSLETEDWYAGTPPGEAQKICGILGLSPELLFLISSITSLASGNQDARNVQIYGQHLEVQLQSLRQWTPEQPGDIREVLMATAEAFRIATLIYLRCRLYGLTRFSPAVMELNDALAQLLLSLPVKGPLYTAIYPVWPLFVAAVTANSEKRDRLYQRVVPIREGDKNTLPAVLKRVSGMRIWLANQDATQPRRIGWWDEMLQPTSSTTALPVGRLLCLG